MTLLRRALIILSVLAVVLLLWEPLAPTSLLRADGCADAWITMKVKSKLFAKGTGMSTFNINIDTEECVVTLNGCVDSQEHIAKASEIAAATKSVKSVQNRLSICAKEEGVDNCADATITAGVKSVIFGKEGFTAFKINIDTEQCVVTLNGCVGTDAQRQEANEAAYTVKGVKKVNNKLVLCPDEDD